MTDFSKIAHSYHQDAHAANKASIDGEPEAQLTIPVSNLIRQVADAAGLGELQLIRESRLDGSRPDFAVLHTKGKKSHHKGYIELKAPDVTVDGSQWTGRNKKQWELMSLAAEVLLVCNGRQARLYKDGAPLGADAALPYDKPESWDAAPLISLIGRFLDTRPTPITTVSNLSQRLATRTADLRDRLLWLLEQNTDAGETAKGGYAAWKQHIHPESSHRDFADGVSQVVAYGMVLAALSTKNADADLDGYITVAEARDAIRHISPVMAAAFAPLVDKPVLFAAVEVELGALETLISAINPEKVNKSADKRGEPWLYFYEDFLSVYDPEERKQAGVYYTPTAVVKAMVRIVDHIIVEEFGIRMGFADSKVVTLDPATGTGTFPLAVIDRAAARAEEQRGAAGAMQAAQSLAANLFAFELLPGPYSVAHLRLSQRLKELNPNHNKAAQVILTDTLESPVGVQQQWSLFGDAEVLATEQNRAKRVKADQRVTVVIGNPPYRRLEKSIVGRGSGGWVVNGAVPGRKSNKSLFDDMLDVAKKETIFSHHASLYNLYVYFWRWAIWKAFEAHGDGPGVVAFITGSSWLTGPGFVGLRKLVREVCDEAWILDLGGDNHGANPEENVFAIETPVAVVILVRKGTKDKTKPASINYRRISGTADEKIAAMERIANSENPLLIGDWITPSNEWMDVMTPATGGQSWFDMPALTDIFPWQCPGVMWNRLWPIAPEQNLLIARWKKFSASSLDDRSNLYVTAKTGRNILTKVAGMKRLVELTGNDAHEPVVRFAYRSFDRQWAFNDLRLAALERPALWQSLSSKQIFLVSMMTAEMSAGPCITSTDCVPDKHYFRGSFGGKDIIPLYRDADAKQPNITKGLQKILAEKLGIKPPTPEDIAAYVYALLSASHYQERFVEELKTPGPRVPITADPKLWQEAVTTGRYLLWLHTYAERFQDASAKQGKHILPVPGISWEQPVTQMPQAASDINYDPTTKLLKVGNGCISGVRNDVWAYSVSGMPVMKKWLGYRTVKGAGRAASSTNPLDRIRPTSWPDEWNDELLDLIRVLTLTLDKQQEIAVLLDQICSGALIAASDLPKPKPAETKPPTG